MKKIIFSFDDGLKDFYENVFPILKKYNIKATLNVITGYSDSSVLNKDYRCCTLKELNDLLSYGIEIANHSDDHCRTTTLSSYDSAQKKLASWFPEYKIRGVATPYTQSVPPGFYEWCKLNKIKYVRFGDLEYKYMFQKKMVQLRLISFFRIYCFNNSHYSKRKGIKIIYSIPIFAKKDVDFYKKIIETSAINPKITFMFHSIFDKECMFDSCPYPSGAWTTTKFEELIKWIISKGYEICRQCDTL